MAESIDKQMQIAEVYADALFTLAQQSGNVDAYLGELEELVALEAREADFAGFMNSEALDSDRRRDGLEKMLRGRLSDDVLNTLLVMNRNGRYGLSEALLRAFSRRQMEADQRVQVTVTSATELNKTQRGDIEKTVRDLSGRKPVTAYRVDPEILAGLVVEVDDVRYDNSARHQLDIARRQFLERTVRVEDL